MTQGDAVYNAVVEVLGETPTGKVELNEEQLKRVHQRVLMAFKNGEVTKSSGGTDDVALAKYVPGLCNNWLRKDLRLNGGTPYVPKNPGSRSGSGDESVRAMKQLLSMTTDEDARATIQLELDKRIAELKPKKEIDASKLPESLRHLIPQ